MKLRLTCHRDQKRVDCLVDLVGTNPMDNLAVRHSAVNGTFFHLLAGQVN